MTACRFRRRSVLCVSGPLGWRGPEKIRRQNQRDASVNAQGKVIITCVPARACVHTVLASAALSFIYRQQSISRGEEAATRRLVLRVSPSRVRDVCRYSQVSRFEGYRTECGAKSAQRDSPGERYHSEFRDVSLASPGIRTGSSTVTYTVAPNSGPSRITHLTFVARRSRSIRQGVDPR
jgi:hypothetical protein